MGDQSCLGLGSLSLPTSTVTVGTELGEGVGQE